MNSLQRKRNSWLRYEWRAWRAAVVHFLFLDTPYLVIMDNQDIIEDIEIKSLLAKSDHAVKLLAV